MRIQSTTFQKYGTLQLIKCHVKAGFCQFSTPPSPFQQVSSLSTWGIAEKWWPWVPMLWCGFVCCWTTPTPNCYSLLVSCFNLLRYYFFRLEPGATCSDIPCFISTDTTAVTGRVGTIELDRTLMNDDLFLNPLILVKMGEICALCIRKWV